jgi:hypothetical protein
VVRAGEAMRIALAIFCIGAVAFLLRVLAALLEEAKAGPSKTVIHFARFKPARRQGELIEMKADAQNPDVASGTGKRIAL